MNRECYGWIGSAMDGLGVLWVDWERCGWIESVWECNG